MKVAVLGYGTVGSGVVEIINSNNDEVSAKCGEKMEVKYILDLRDFPGDPMEKYVVHDYEVIVNDPEVAIICETMGGVEPAYTFSKRALEAGKSVCTSNKELVALHGPELIKIAREHNCSYLFEASVGGGIPIIRPLGNALSPEKIESITGILNGTTNYMLTKMDEEGCDYDAVLKEAQALGYAERNPAADVEGHDACRKIAILSSLVCGKKVNFEDISTEGITEITTADFKFAKEIGKSIKLLGMSKITADGVCAMVAPFMVDKTHPLYSVRDVFNAIYVHGNMVDDVMFYGRGAGKLPTASAVVSDVIEMAKNQGRCVSANWEDEAVTLLNIEEVPFKYSVRIKNGDNASDKLTKAFGVDAITYIKDDNGDGEIHAVIGEAMTKKELDAKLKDFEVVKVIRIF